MTTAKFFLFTILAIVLTTVVKLFFIEALNLGSAFIVYFMWLVIALITIGCCRRLGVITYLESALVIIVWLLLSLFFDLLIISTLVGDSVYHHIYLWVSYGVMALMIFLFHKKRHVEVRHIQRAAKLPVKDH